MLKIDKQASTYREQRFTIRKKSEYTVAFFNNEMPNIFYLRNESLHTAYVSLSKTPTPTSFEFKVSGNTSDVIGKPSSTSRLYIYNDSDEDITIYLISVNDIFNLDYLKNFKVSIDDAIAQQLKFDGIIKGFDASLPVGANKIGEVGIDGWADVQSISVDTTAIASDTIDVKTKLDTLHSDMTSLIASIASINLNVTKTLSILTSAWVANTTYSGYNYRCTIADAVITTSKDVDIAFAMGSITAVQNASVAPASVVYNGGFYLYAVSVPSQTVTGTYTIKAVS